MANVEFKVGDVVQLKSGGPTSVMTVHAPYKVQDRALVENWEEIESKYIYCDWYDGNTLHREYFDKDELIKVE